MGGGENETTLTKLISDDLLNYHMTELETISETEATKGQLKIDF